MEREGKVTTKTSGEKELNTKCSTNLETTAAEINDLDTTFVWLLQKYVFRLKVAMYHSLCSEETQRGEQLDCETTYETNTNALEFIVFDELVKIDGHELSWKYQRIRLLL